MRHTLWNGNRKTGGASWYVQASSEASERLGGEEEGNTQIARFSRARPGARRMTAGMMMDGQDRRIMGPLVWRRGGRSQWQAERAPSRPRWAAVGWERG